MNLYLSPAVRAEILLLCDEGMILRDITMLVMMAQLTDRDFFETVASYRNLHKQIELFLEYNKGTGAEADLAKIDSERTS